MASINLYGGTYSLFKTLLPRLGITVKWAKMETREAFAPLIDDKTKMLFVESIGNPRCSIPDLQDLADLAHENHVPFVVRSCSFYLALIDRYIPSLLSSTGREFE